MKPLQRTGLSPSTREIGWLQYQLKQLKPKSFLEFGGGWTSKNIYEAIQPNPYVIIETYEALFNPIKMEIPNAQLITTTWEDIPQQKYDAILIDSSAGYPPNPTGAGLRRLDALKWCINYNLIGKYIIIHDAFGKSGLALYKFMEDSPNFTLVEEKHNRKGFAIFSI